MKSDDDKIDVKIDVNENALMMCLGKKIYGRFRVKGNQVEGDVAYIEGKRTYHRSRVKGGIDLTPQA